MKKVPKLSKQPATTSDSFAIGPSAAFGTSPLITAPASKRRAALSGDLPSTPEESKEAELFSKILELPQPNRERLIDAVKLYNELETKDID